MTKIMPCSFIAILLGVCLYTAPAQAQLSRTFVSGANGNDSNDCNRLTPCRTFQGAHDKTNPGGEIMVLDPGAYGNVTITKAINIVNDGVGEASMFVSGGNTGITINAGFSDRIRLRGLTINGNGSGGGNGIVFNSGGSLTVENCVIRNLTGPLGDTSAVGHGIIFQPTGGDLSVTNTVVAENTNYGIHVKANGSAVLSRVEVKFHGYAGIRMQGNIRATVVDSVLANNGWGLLTSVSSIDVIRSVLLNNVAALHAMNGTTLRVGQSTISGSVTTAVGSGVRSYGDNNIEGNNDNPVIPTIPKK